MTELGKWIAEVRRAYVAQIRESGVKAAWHYFDFDETGNVVIPATMEALARFYHEMLTPKDKITFMQLIAPIQELDHPLESIFWDVPRDSHLTPGFMTMREWLRRNDINLD